MALEYYGTRWLKDEDSFQFPSLLEYITQTRQELSRPMQAPPYAAADENSRLEEVNEKVKADPYLSRASFHESLRNVEREYQTVRYLSYANNPVLYDVCVFTANKLMKLTPMIFLYHTLKPGRIYNASASDYQDKAYIYVSDQFFAEHGMLKPEELCFMIGHELGHVQCHHIYISFKTPQYCGLAKFLVDYNYTPKDAGRGTGQKKFKNVIAARVNLKSDAISDAGITLIDTPGIGASPKDDALVAEVLKSGCELLIVASMDNSFQEAKVKDYFRDLLVEEDAPLRSVWEAGRAFFVCNVTKSAIRHARENVRTHIKDAFKGWDPEGRLFIVNARDARIRACGVYDYPFFLGGSCTEEERKHAEDSMKDEEVRKGKAKEQPELEAFCQSLGQAAQELCANPEECQKILAPIQEDLEKAGSLLKKLVEEKQKKVKEMDFDFMVLPELKKYLDELEKALSKLREQSKMLEKLDDGRAFSEKEWPLNKPWEPAVNARYLIADDPNRMEEILLQDIESQNWHYRIASRVSERMNVLLREHLAAMEKEAKPEFQYWRSFFDDFRGLLASVDPRGKRLLPPEKVELFLSEADELLSEAEAAGQEAMRSSPAYVLSPEKRFQLGQYLAEKRVKVLAGGLKGRWARFWLDSNVDIDQLSPLATSAAAEGRRAFLTAYRDKLWNGKKSAISELRRKLGKLLAMIGDELHKQSQSVNQQIENEKETARKKQLDELQKPLGAIREIMESAERMENNE